MQYLNPKILEALEFAAIAHKAQNRKSPGHIPYVSHVAAVGFILQRAGFDDEVVIAGILHDTVEDTETNFDDLEKVFGKQVTEFVKGVTEQDGLEWAEKKQAYNDHLKTQAPEIAAISASDLLANRMDQLVMLRAGKNPWVDFSKDPKAYVIKVKKNDDVRIGIIKSILSHPLVAELEQVQKETFELTEKIAW
jgi:(p)ppGpp synthase/HD superfamily hydrolase